MYDKNEMTRRIASDWLSSPEKLDKLKRALESEAIEWGDAPKEEPLYERFTDRARKVMSLANRAALELNHEYIGTEHVLLGLIAENSGVAANVLKNLDIDLAKAKKEVRKIVQPGPEKVMMGKLPQTPRTKKVVEYAIEESRKLRHNYIGTEHLLLGLLREAEGVAAQVLFNVGVKPGDVRDEILNLLGHAPEGFDAKELDRVHKNILGYTRDEASELMIPTLPGTVKDKVGEDKARLLEIARLLSIATDPAYALAQIKKVLLEEM